MLLFDLLGVATVMFQKVHINNLDLNLIMHNIAISNRKPDRW